MKLVKLEQAQEFSNSDIKKNIFNKNLTNKFWICQNPSDKLSWSHFCELIKLDDELERSFYQKQIENENWNIETLKRQMNMYMGYFAKEENMPDENPPIGIILTRNKDELLVEYATYGMDSNLFVSKYELYLPNRDELKKLVDGILEE